MCLLINQEKGSVISKEYLQNGYDNNDDGAGYCYLNEKGKIIIKKYRHFKKFYKAYSEDVKKYGKNSNFIVHFRIGTHGQDEGTINVHPFKVRKGLVFAHNGTINKATRDEVLSDTQMFNKEVLQKLPQDFVYNKGMQTLIAEYIGHSKLVFLDHNGDGIIINEHMGEWVDGVWYSNSSYQSSYGSYGCPTNYGSYNYGWGGVAIEKSTSSLKPVSTKSKVVGEDLYECDWCGDETEKLHKIDMADSFIGIDNDEPYIVEMCDVCLEYEKKRKVDDELYENEKFDSAFGLEL